MNIYEEGVTSKPAKSLIESRTRGTALWIKLIDLALLISILLLIFTDHKIFYFHLVFILLTVGAFYWQLQAFIWRAGVTVIATTAIVIAFISSGHIHLGELVEIPMLTLILLLVFTIARQRASAEDALREANNDLERRVSAQTTDLRQEIAEHRKTEQTLRESEERYRHLVQLSFEAITIHTKAEIVYLNPAGKKLFGVANATELQGKSFLAFVHPDERDAVALSLQQVHQKGKGTPLTESKFIRLDGDEVNVEMVTIPILYQGQAAQQTVIRDITIRKQAEQARLDERMTIARDLHDSLGQSLGYLHLKLDEIANHTSSQVINSFAQDLIRMRDVANNAYEQVRGMLAGLLPANTIQLSLALRHKASIISGQAQFQVQVINRGQECMLPAVLQQQILSLCSEALTNVMKHAQARFVRIELRWTHETLTITIEDNGIGFDPEAPRGRNSLGIQIMQERTAQMLGQLLIQSQHAAGTILTLVVPLSAI